MSRSQQIGASEQHTQASTLYPSIHFATFCKILTCFIILVSCLSACTANDEKKAGESVPHRLELTELFRLGNESRGDTILFGDIEDLVAVDKDGRIFIGERQDPKVYVFDANGNMLKIVGQAGDGPGEFQRSVSASRTAWEVN
ncbi:MAG: 6-bladed beta-propeller [Bacteroidetes bacterium]|nr:6-bladed beta-propeller [Bacteroidota bacterium]MCY4206134.1 6-bladed beta-propeller [Bacteroidota bacterium]